MTGHSKAKGQIGQNSRSGELPVAGGGDFPKERHEEREIAVF